MDALPTKEGEMVGVLLFKPGTPVYQTIEGLADGAAARRFFEEAMPPLLPYLRDDELERFVRRPVTATTTAPTVTSPPATSTTSTTQSPPPSPPSTCR